MQPLVTGVGGDEFAGRLLDTLTAEGIDTALVRRVPGPSGIARIVVDGREAIERFDCCTLL